MPTRTTTRKTVSLEEEVCRKAVKAARAENRTLSNYVNTMLRERFALPSSQSREKEVAT